LSLGFAQFRRAPLETAFLKHITDDPDDVVARLVFADWLCEQDDPGLNERGEFIRLQYALAEKHVSEDDRVRLIRRQKELLARYRERWEEPFRGLVRNCDYRGGFAERVTLTAEQLVDGFPELVERTPVVRVRLVGLTSDTVSVIAAETSLARLRELDLTSARIAPHVFREFIASPHLGRLRALNLARTGVGDEGVRALVASTVFRRLQYLNLSDAGITATGVHAMVNAIYNRSSSLQILVLRGAPRVQSGSFPPLPPGLSSRLRQSLQAQIGLDPSVPRDFLAHLHASRETLSVELRRWVEWVRAHGCAGIPLAVKLLPLPAHVRRVFAMVCQRRIVWRATRLKTVLPAIPLMADGHSVDLPEMLRILIGMAQWGNEARALVECLLDLYLRYERGELQSDGKTRGGSLMEARE